MKVAFFVVVMNRWIPLRAIDIHMFSEKVGDCVHVVHVGDAKEMMPWSAVYIYIYISYI
jgi:hypothetical protein